MAVLARRLPGAAPPRIGSATDRVVDLAACSGRRSCRSGRPASGRSFRGRSTGGSSLVQQYDRWVSRQRGGRFLGARAFPCKPKGYPRPSDRRRDVQCTDGAVERIERVRGILESAQTSPQMNVPTCLYAHATICPSELGEEPTGLLEKLVGTVCPGRGKQPRNFGCFHLPRQVMKTPPERGAGEGLRGRCSPAWIDFDLRYLLFFEHGCGMFER